MADAHRIYDFWPYNNPTPTQSAQPPSPFSPSSKQGFRYTSSPSPESSRSNTPSPPPSPPPPPSYSHSHSNSQTYSPPPPFSPRSSIYFAKVMPPATALSASGSSSSSGSQSGRSATLPFSRAKSITDFEVERSERPPKTPSYNMVPLRGVLRKTDAETTEQIFQSHVSSLMAAKKRPFSICGHIPLDSQDLKLFFRSRVSSRP